jgi:hypothetical protein
VCRSNVPPPSLPTRATQPGRARKPTRGTSPVSTTRAAEPSLLKRRSPANLSVQSSVRPWCGPASPERTTSRTRKPPICSRFSEPSDGLEPSTPSLPWRIRAVGEGWRNSACYGVFPAVKPFRAPGAPLPRRALRLPEKPRTCPQDLSPESRSAAKLRRSDEPGHDGAAGVDAQGSCST